MRSSGDARRPRRTNQTVTEVVRASIELYYERFEEACGGAERILEETGFVGCGEADADLSTTYKQRLGETLPHLADASLVVLAEHLGSGRILSTDQREFRTYRWKNRRPFHNLLA